MDRVQKYVYKVYGTKSFSKAAKELYISQPSLSSMVKKLEKELGFLIFDRSVNPVELTPEGRIYIEYLEEMMQNEKEMIHKISRLSVPEEKKLAVGGSNYVSRVLLPRACGEFHRRFPDIEVSIDMCSNLFNKLENDVLDVVITHRMDTTKFIGEPLTDDRYVIVVRKDTPGADKIAKYALTREQILSGDVSDYEITDYSIFENIEFIRYGKQSGVWAQMYELLEHGTFSPCRISSYSFDAHYDMMLYGNGAVVTSEFLISRRPDRSDELLYFPTNVHRQAKLVYKKDKPLSGCAREFIDIVKELLISNKIR